MTTPRATYRLQLEPRFGFASARAAIPYFVELGISHLYLSPILQAAAGSTHGYDVIDPERVSRELGGDEELAALTQVAREAGLAILLDIVPNHMSIDTGRTGVPGNRWWLDVLENGAASFYAHVFDVDWTTGDDRILLPVLGERYGRALSQGQLAIVRAGGTFEVRAGELRLPLSPRSIGAIVRRAGDRIRHAELAFLGDTLCALSVEHGPVARARRHRDKAVLLRRLAELGEVCARAIDDELAATNKDPADLDSVLESQNYRLAHWSVAGSQLGYRRFFDITSLVGLRNEDPEVFAASHARILGWLADGSIDGVRFDHVDGLREPQGYLARLREAAPNAWIVVEKIVARGRDCRRCGRPTAPPVTSSSITWASCWSIRVRSER
ncbi:MAG: alpha-amylase family glycosyl hydrolase [Kofleriaceae bacterium]